MMIEMVCIEMRLYNNDPCVISAYNLVLTYVWEIKPIMASTKDLIYTKLYASVAWQRSRELTIEALVPVQFLYI